MNDKLLTSPFDGKARLITKIHTHEIARRYRDKCGADISSEICEYEFAELYQCESTGYKFWYPFELAGGEALYKILRKSWPNYYRSQRWEYKLAREVVEAGNSCLEVGCGRGFFLRSIESVVKSAIGLELNREAIEQSVCQSPILNENLEEHASHNKEAYDCVFSFQVLEHVTDPLKFLRDCRFCLRSGGSMVISVPNDNYIAHRDMADAFNLPPHHMGGYNEEVLKKIGDLMDLKVVDIYFSPPESPGIQVTDAVANALPWRIFSWISARIGKLLLKLLREPGHTILIVFRKP